MSILPHASANTLSRHIHNIIFKKLCVSKMLSLSQLFPLGNTVRRHSNSNLSNLFFARVLHILLFAFGNSIRRHYLNVKQHYQNLFFWKKKMPVNQEYEMYHIFLLVTILSYYCNKVMVSKSVSSENIYIIANLSSQQLKGTQHFKVIFFY